MQSIICQPVEEWDDGELSFYDPNMDHEMIDGYKKAAQWQPFVRSAYVYSSTLPHINSQQIGIIARAGLGCHVDANEEAATLLHCVVDRFGN